MTKRATQDMLEVSFCQSADWREMPGGPVGIKYNCGLTLSSAVLAMMSDGTVTAINSVHERHHARAHEKREWTVKTTYHNDDTTSLRCCHREDAD